MKDSTERMQLVQQAMEQADKHTSVSSKFQSVTSAATSLGLGGFGANLGRELSIPFGSAVGGLAGGLGLDWALKTALKKAFIDPTDSVLSGKLMSHLADAPTFDDTAATHYKNAVAQVPKNLKDPTAWTKTASFEHLSQAEKVSALKFADYSKRWFSTLKSIITAPVSDKLYNYKPAPLQTPAGVPVPAKVYNTAQNDQPPDLGDAGSILSGGQSA